MLSKRVNCYSLQGPRNFRSDNLPTKSVEAGFDLRLIANRDESRLSHIPSQRKPPAIAIAKPRKIREGQTPSRQQHLTATLPDQDPPSASCNSISVRGSLRKSPEQANGRRKLVLTPVGVEKVTEISR